MLASQYKFRVQLKDKGNTSYSVDRPEEFLSKKSIDRRKKQHLSIEKSDLPISEEYINRIEELGCKVVAKSKWIKTVSVHCSDSLLIDKLKDLDFVENVEFAWKSNDSITTDKKTTKRNRPMSKKTGYYGFASDQITTVNGQHLHDSGYFGEDMEIAVIDGGYTNLDEILLLDNVFIKGMKDFVYDGVDMLKSAEHGTSTLSTMAGNYANEYVGTAPRAKYWLLRSEDGRSEYPIEEDYWITAVEYADSVGVDLINTSLGYSKFDAPAKSYTYEQLDGNTSPMTRAADIAVTKGIFLVVSAGNEGALQWKKITVPADAKNVLTVGAMTKDSVIASFSSKGPTYDGRIKPDIVALGSQINVIGSSGEIIINSGTSFAGPVMCGLLACLWQAFPDLTNLELLDIIKRSGSKYSAPGESYGYGVPDMKLAMEIAKDITTGIEVDEIETIDSSNFEFQSDSVGHIRIKKHSFNDSSRYTITIISIDGRLLVNDSFDKEEFNFNAGVAEKRAYVINLRNTEINQSKKILF